MKRLILIFVFVLTLSSLAESKHFTPTGSVGMFYHSLKPYGEWIYLDDDMIVWRPVTRNSYWHPYSDGRWVWTRHGWYWDSFEPFGWATFHYGRWIFDDYYGWVWMPDNDWAPAWVEWRYDDYYIGWAPLPPYASFRINFGIQFSITWRSHYSYWNFVSYNNFCGRSINSYIIAPSKVERFFGRTKYRTNYHMRDREIYNGGIERNIVERRSKSRISEVNVRSADSFDRIDRSRDKEVFVYRPSDRNEKIDLQEIKRGERKINIERERVSIDRNKNERNNTLDFEKRNPNSEIRNDIRENEKVKNIPEESTLRKPVIKNEKSWEADRISRNNESKVNPERKRETKSNNNISGKSRQSVRKESANRIEKPVVRSRDTAREKIER